MNVDQYTNLILITRQTARKYIIKVFEVNCIYIAYLNNKKDSSIYLNRYMLGRSVAKSYSCKNASQLTIHKLIEKVDNNTYLFTPLACEMLSYIDEQLSLIDKPV